MYPYEKLCHTHSPMSIEEMDNQFIFVEKKRRIQIPLPFHGLGPGFLLIHAALTRL
jgi:hypothetical protein